MLPALIAAAATIGGGIYGQYQARRREDTAIQRRVADARRAGVHPIAALGAGGLSGSGGSTVFGGGEGIARAGQAVGNALSKSLDTDSQALKALVLEKAGLENELLRTQITRSKVEAASTPAPLGPMSQYGIPGQSQTVQLPFVPGTSIAHKVNSPGWTPNLHVGVPYRTNPHFSDAQTIQDRYGELVESAYGAVTVPADFLWNNPAGDVPYWKTNKRSFKGHSRHFREAYDDYSRNRDYGVFY